MSDNASNFIAPAVAIITGLFTILGVLIANRSNHNKLNLSLQNENERIKNEILRDRFEELYTSLEKWAGKMVTHHITLRKVMEGELNYNQALDLQIEQKTNFDVQRMFMLAEVYFSQCQKEFEELKDIRNEASKLQNDFKKLYKQSGNSSVQHAELLTNILSKFNVAVDKYKASLLANYMIK